MSILWYMTEDHYKVLAHNFEAKEIPVHRQPLGYSQSDEPTLSQITCEECGDEIPLRIRAKSKGEYRWLNRLLIFNIIFSILIGVVASIISSSIYIGSGIAILFFALIALVSGEPDELRIEQSYDNHLDKLGIYKKHSIDQMRPEEAEEWGIDPYKTI